MLKIILVFLILIIGIVRFYGYRFSRLVKISEGIIAQTTPYSLSGNDYSVSLLVLGDSTAVGIGANTSEDTIAAMLANYIKATHVENRGVTGALIEDVLPQIQASEQKEYHTILLQIGGNNMTRLHNLDEITKDYEIILSSLPKHEHLIVMCCGNLGGAKIFPRIVGYYYEYISRSYQKRFSEIVSRYGGIYVDVFDERSVDPFIKEPAVYLAPDLFHPSSTGYKYWFGKVESKLEKK